MVDYRYCMLIFCYISVLANVILLAIDKNRPARGRVKIHPIIGHIQTLYLVEYADKLMLLDGGCRADVTTVITFIEQTLQRSIGDLKVVVVTHMHPDHAGAAHLLRKRTQCKIVTGAQTTHWYQGWQGVLMFWSDLALAHWMAKRLGKSKARLWYPRKLYADLQLADQQRIPLFEEWQVLNTPGHTDRDLSLYHAEQGILYVADLMVEVKNHLIAPFPVFYPKLYRRSVERVYQLNPQQLLLAHGGEVNLDYEIYQHILKTAPRSPVTHWRVVSIKMKKLVRGLAQRFIRFSFFL